MGTGGKDGKFCLFFSHYGGIAVAGVYLCSIRQDKDLTGYGFDYLCEITRRLRLTRASGKMVSPEIRCFPIKKHTLPGV